MIVDANILHNNKPYSFYNALSRDTTSISAYTAGGKYYLTLRDIKYSNRFQIEIRTTTSIVFDNLLVQYDVREGKVVR